MSENKIELSGIFSEGYGIIPKKLMRAKIDKHIKLILSYMLSFTGGGSECFPSIRKMAKELQMSSATIIKYIKMAENKGYISKSKLYPNNPLNHANKYKMLFLDVSPCKNIDVSPIKTPCISESNSDVLPNKTSMYQQLIQNNNNINNNNINNNNINNKVRITQSQLDELVNLYPTKCPIRFASTERSVYNKDKLKEIIRVKGMPECKQIIKLYIEDCKNTKTYIKYFKTFVNNFPSISDFNTYKKADQLDKQTDNIFKQIEQWKREAGQ